MDAKGSHGESRSKFVGDVSLIALGTVSNELDVPEQVQIRRDKRQVILDRGLQAYPVSLPITTSIAQLRERYGDLDAEATTGVIVGIAGRVIFSRNTGKLAFATIAAGSGETIQAMVSLGQVGEVSLSDWKALVDLGDQIFVEGEVISSKRGELSVFVDSWSMAAKSLRPLPVAHKEMNEESRVRQRYIDLIMRPEAQVMARTRVKAVSALRTSLSNREYLEIETPMLQTQPGGATARPFITHSNAFGIDLFLRIAPELFLKRAVVGGLDRVFEINRNFRNEGADSSHSPEFAMLEFYQAFADYQDMARITRELIQEAAQAVAGSMTVTHFDASEHDLSGEWPQIDLYGSLSQAVNQDVTPDTSRAVLESLCNAADIKFAPTWVNGKLVEELFEHYVIPTFTGPTFVMHFPVDTSPLTRDHRSRAGVVEKWDLYIDGFELATGYSELVDPVIQRERLVEQATLGAQGDKEAMPLDEDFLRALEHGMPPSGGVGMGVDRLLMVLTGQGIRETILFPLVKPERDQ